MSRIVRIHCVKPIAFLQIGYGLHTWIDGPEALVCIFSGSDERVIEVPGVTIPPGNRNVEDQFGNKPCLHLNVDGDLYALPDQFRVVKQKLNGWYGLTINGNAIVATGHTQLEFCRVGDHLSLSHGTTSFEYDTVLDYQPGQQFKATYSGTISSYWGKYSGHCTGTVGKTGACAPDLCVLDTNGLKWPLSLPSAGFSPHIYYSNFDVRGIVPNFNGYTFDDVIITICLMLKDLLVEVQVIQCTKEYWQIALSDCLVDALNGLRLLQIDSIAYLRDLVDLPRALSIFRKVKRHPLSKKTWADVYLTYRYGLRLFANDTRAIAKAVMREVNRNSEPFQTARGTRKRSVKALFGNPIEQTIHAKVYADNYSLKDMSLIEAAKSVDLYPSLSNVWDLIPYSFVVDWFLPVGDILGKLDAQSYVQDLHTRSCVASVKSTKLDHIDHAFNYSGDIKVTCYERKVISPNGMSRALSSDSAKFFDGVTPLHFFDGLALRFQRR